MTLGIRARLFAQLSDPSVVDRERALFGRIVVVMIGQPTPPSRTEVEARFTAILDGGQSRDEVDRWATRAMQTLEYAEVDETTWWALGMLAGIDLRDGPGGPYLYDDEQVLGWLTEFRERCGVIS